MRIQWSKLIVKLTLWLAAEVVLGAVGLDTLLDYGEFLDHSHGAMVSRCGETLTAGLKL